MSKKVFVQTFGCQMNDYDTTKIKAQLAHDDFESTEDPKAADLILLNTCSIRDKAEQKMHSALGRFRRLKRRGQDVTIGIVGCVAQQEGQTLLSRYKDVQIVFGPDGIPKVRELVGTAMREQKQVLYTEELDLETYPFVTDLDPNAAEKVGAFVTIQKGCDNKCTFCIVPTTRGAEASRPSRQILNEVRGLVSTGVREITLIGQNVNSYGLKRSSELNFSQLLYAVHDIEGVERIRYTTSHPRDMGADVWQAYRDLPKLTSHLHLPVQSGSDSVLRRMKRFYTRDHFLRVVDELRDARPDLALTTDIIVGFPGETDEDFEQTMSLLEVVGFVGAFSFKYSQRPGTSALRLKDAVDVAVASERLTRFQTRQSELQRAYVQSYTGRVVSVLVEGPSKQHSEVLAGRTSTNVMINFPGDATTLTGRTVDVKVNQAFAHTGRGELVRQGAA